MPFYPPANNTYETLPEIVNGYHLEKQEKGWFSVVSPEDGESKITNPSFEIGTTGWKAVNSTIAQDATYAVKGFYSLSVTPTNTNLAGTYYSVDFTPVLTSPYTFSVFLRGHPSDTFQIYFANNAGTLLSTSPVIEVRGSSRWQRLVCINTNGVAQFYRLYVVRKAGGSTNPFYIDCAMLEKKKYATTYFDGDSKGVVLGSLDYWWGTTAHASYSYRRATSNGGREVSLLDLGFRLIAIVGLGMFPVINVTTPISTGGELYQRTLPTAREFTLAGTLDGSVYPRIQKQRNDILNLVNPMGSSSQYPLTLTYHQIDDDGNETDAIDIQASYQSGLEGTVDNLHQERLAIVFKQFIPYLSSHYGGSALIDNHKTSPFYAYPAPAHTILPAFLKRDYKGVWSNPTLDADIFGGTVYGVSAQVFNDQLSQIDTLSFTGESDSNTDHGVLYVTLQYSDAIGSIFEFYKDEGKTQLVATCGMIYDTQTLAITESNASGLNGSLTSADLQANDSDIIVRVGSAASIESMAVSPNGEIYVGGLYSFDEGGGTVYNIGLFNGTAMVTIGAGPGANDKVNVVHYDPGSGIVWAAGKFTTFDALANGNRIVFINPSTDTVWSDPGTGAPDGEVFAIASYTDPATGITKVWVGGSFTSMGGVANTAYLAVWTWDPVALSGTWAAVATPITGIVRALATDTLGNVYVGGDFTDGASKRYIVKYDPSGVQSTLKTGVGGPVYALAFDTRGNLCVGGNFGEADTLVTYSGFVQWNGSSWITFLDFFNVPSWHAITMGDTRKIVVDPASGLVYISVTGNWDSPSKVWVYNGNGFHPLDFYTGISKVMPLVFNQNTNELYVTIPYTTTVGYNPTSYDMVLNNPGRTRVYPTLLIQGPVPNIYGLLNFTTGKSVYFTDLVANDTEKIRVYFSPTGAKVFSSMRGDLTNRIAPDSDTNFYLAPGDNAISLIDNPVGTSNTIATLEGVMSDISIVGANANNSDDGKLYFKTQWISDVGGLIEIYIYMDSGFSDQVGVAYAPRYGGFYVATVSSADGLSGTILVNTDLPLTGFTYYFKQNVQPYKISWDTQYQSIDEAAQ